MQGLGRWLAMAALALVGPSVSASPIGELVFEEPQVVGTAKSRYYRGRFPALSDYTPWGIEMPVAYMTPGEDCFTDASPARLEVFLHPYDMGKGHFLGKPWSRRSPRDTVEVRNQEDSYGEGIGGRWGYSGGQVGRVANYNGERIATSLDYILDRHGDAIDLEAGIVLRGKSLGGTGVLLQSMILPRYQQHIALVESSLGHMLMAKCCRNLVNNSWGGRHYRDIDFRVQYDTVSHIHYFWRGGSNDNMGRFDPEFLDLCERYKISCAATWMRSGHGFREEGVNMSTAPFTDPNQDVTLDKPLPVITAFSGNYRGAERGHHNRGISWNHGGIVDQPYSLRIPLKYRAMTGIGKGVPDQPQRVTFSLTPRRAEAFAPRPGERVEWVFGDQSGRARVGDDGLLTIEGLKLSTGDRYTLLIINRP